MSSKRFWLTTLASLFLITLCLGIVADRYFLKRIEQNAADELVLLAELRRGALERYLKTAESELLFWATNAGLLDIYLSALADWEARRASGEDPSAAPRAAYIDNNPYPMERREELLDAGDGTEYSVQHHRAQPLMRLLLSERGYYDFFAITPAGDVLYTIKKEDDYATNLMTGPYSDSGLGEVFRRAMASPAGEVVFADFARYAPSSDLPAMFMATTLRDEAGEIVGVWALQLPTERIIDVMRPSRGFGESGQIYVVGEDMLMRSDSRFSEESTVLAVNADSATVRRALEGENGVEYTDDYRGVEVLSAFTGIEVGGSNWAIMSEISREELMRWSSRDRPAVAGLLFLGFGVTLWSAWYIRRTGTTEIALESPQTIDLDFDPGSNVS